MPLWMEARASPATRAACLIWVWITFNIFGKAAKYYSVSQLCVWVRVGKSQHHQTLMRKHDRKTNVPRNKRCSHC